MTQFPGMDWDERIAVLPGANILQTREWGEVKRITGWEALGKTWDGGAGLVLRRPIRVGGFAARLSILYIPRGPLLNWGDGRLRGEILDDLQHLARKSGAIFLKIDPAVVLGIGIPGDSGDVENSIGADVKADLLHRGWRFSPDQVQFRNTVIIDLEGTEEVWLARMKQKARYNIRLAQKKGVKVRKGHPQDFHMLYQMYAETSVRDNFVIRPESYYRQVWTTFHEKGMCVPLIAEVDNEPVAAVILMIFAQRAWYLYGMSRETHREKMPNYMLQWEAMRAAKAAGAVTYDLWGAPDKFVEDDPMWGVFRFKDGLGGKVVRTLGAWDFPARPAVYTLYTKMIPSVLNFLRQRRKKDTRQEVSP
jgi:peptidoglycan pentaglycine glycine transferase (the first glycine)